MARTRGAFSILARLSSLATRGDRALRWVIVNWWLTVPLFELCAVVLAAGLCARYLWPLLVRLEQDQPAPAEELPLRGGGGGVRRARRNDPDEREKAPVPVELERVSYQYPGSRAWAVAEVSLAVQPGSFLAIVGPNGSGKSTLVRLLAGRLSPTLGTVRRAGDPGFGLPGGTSMIFQRPESQVLGVRARDDVVWGLSSTPRPDVTELLTRVGLQGFEERETSGLSGGELQRLAIAACLAREPRLLISDEATAMIDGPGRAEVVGLLESLAAAGITVVHVTHREAEATKADNKILMLAGRLVAASSFEGSGAPGTAGSPEPHGSPFEGTARPSALGARSSEPPHSTARPTTSDGASRAPEPLLAVRGLGFVYANGTPWAHRALAGVDLALGRGEGLVVTGDNGSGKSTLAWILAGLLPPTEGEALLAGEPVIAGTGAVGISFQHARLQLIRPTVLADVGYGADNQRAADALRAVGLDPATMGPRRVDELSGGEQRRVRARRPARTRPCAPRARRALRGARRRGQGRTGGHPRPASRRARDGDSRRFPRSGERRAARRSHDRARVGTRRPRDPFRGRDMTMTGAQRPSGEGHEPDASSPESPAACGSGRSTSCGTYLETA